jgi:hypothetical protein
MLLPAVVADPSGQCGSAPREVRKLKMNGRGVWNYAALRVPSGMRSLAGRADAAVGKCS